MAKMTASEFLASLPPALSLRGEGSSSRDSVVARIRDEVAMAVLSVLPDGARAAVRCDRSGWTPHVKVDLVAWAGQPLCAEYVSAVMDESLPNGVPVPCRGCWTARNRLADEVNDALALLGSVADRHNFDKSDSMTDYFHVGYYLTVSANTLIATATSGIAEEVNPALAALRVRAREAAKRLPKGAVRSICGRPGVEGAGEYTLNRLVALDEAAAGRPVFYDRRRARWVVEEREALRAAVSR
jgi:hypothetical protein